MSGKESSNSLVSESQVYGWQNRVLAIEEEMRTLQAERGKLERLIDMAKLLEREAGLLVAASAGVQSPHKLIINALDDISSTDNFPKAVSLIVERADDGVTYDEIREAILHSALAAKLRRSDKGFYHALARAKERGDFVEYQGYTFTPANLAAFTAKVAAGIKQDKIAVTGFGSPLMDALTETVARNGGITAKEAIDIVRNGSEKHKLAPLKSDGSAYNAIARLKERGELEGFGRMDRQLRVGPNASEEMKRLSRTATVVTLKNNTATGN
jgi:hypothetical protein